VKYIIRTFFLIVAIIFMFFLVVVVPSRIEWPNLARLNNARAMLKTAIYPDQINHFNNNFKIIEELPSFIRTKNDRNYNYIVYISLSNAAVSQRDQIAEGSKNVGAHFVAYAWPKRWNEDGNKVLAITENGTLYETDEINEFPIELFSNGLPIWNILKKSWESEVDKRWKPMGQDHK
jgi:hypothetical protein